ncbi:MAG: protease complex subunit PrcB family protein [bacterium]
MPPEVNFDTEIPVALMLGDRMTGGFWIRVDCVRFNEGPGTPPMVTIEYTEMIPGPECIVPQVITQPFFFFAIPRLVNSTQQIEFIHSEEVYNCIEPDCIPMETIDRGHMSMIREPFYRVFRNMNSWHEFWTMHNPNAPVPPVNFEIHMAVVACLGQRPTTGYFASIECIRLIHEDPGTPPTIQVHVMEEIPGPTCEVLQVLTSPFHFVVAPRYDGMDEFMVDEMIYECD